MSQELTRLCLRSPAKINLYLKIRGRRSDGYHEIETLMVPLDLADKMRFERTRKGISLKIIGARHVSPLPTDDRNLVVRAALALQKKFRLRSGAKITLHKRIPIGGGLGGGSSNVATTLQALNQLWRVGATETELRQIAAELGADVPFFLQRQPAVCTGRGDQIWPLNRWDVLRRSWFLLVNPSFGVSTKWAYDHSDAKKIQNERLPALDFTLPSDVKQIALRLENSLEKPVLGKFPILALLKWSLRRHGALGALMSGSGATVFGIMRSRSQGERIARALQREWGPTLWICVARCA